MIRSVFTFAFIFMAFSLVGQSLGLRAGANIANLTGDTDGNTSIIAWQIGPFIDFDLSENVDLNLAVLYSKKGSKDELTDITGGLKYLEVPLMFRLNVSAIFIQAGAYGSYLLSADAGGVDISDSLNNGDYGVSFGAGVNLGNLRLDGRYSIGMADLSDTDLNSIKNSVLTFGAEISF